MRRSHFGRKLSDEHKKKLSDNHWSKTNPDANLIKENIRNSLSNNVISEETRIKISHANTGKRHSEEAKRKMSESAKLRERATLDKMHETNLAIGRYLPLGETRVHNGYVQIKVAHHQGQRNWRPEHRVIMENILGRILERSEHVHHLDGDTLNNKPENLVVLSGQDHSSLNHLIRLSNKIDEKISTIIIKTILRRFPNLDIASMKP